MFTYYNGPTGQYKIIALPDDGPQWMSYLILQTLQGAQI